MRADTETRTERRIYALDRALLSEIRAYQSAKGLSSETEAARRLIYEGLRLHDTAEEVERRLGLVASSYRGLRELAAAELSAHPLLKSIDFTGLPRFIVFTLTGSEPRRFPPEGW